MNVNVIVKKRDICIFMFIPIVNFSMIPKYLQKVFSITLTAPESPAVIDNLGNVKATLMEELGRLNKDGQFYFYLRLIQQF